MARPPAQVRFPGDKNRKQRVKVRGIKQASKEIQKRLERNLEKLLEDPEVILPTIDAELGRPWKDPMAYTLRSIDIVSAKRYNKRWLSKKMVKRRGDGVSRALAGSLLAASEEDWSTVSVFKNPLFGNASYLRRGNGKQGHQAAIQNHNNHRLRLPSGMIMPRLATTSSHGRVALFTLVLMPRPPRSGLNGHSIRVHWT